MDEYLGGYKKQQILLTLIGYFTISFLSNSLALYGVCAGKRAFLLPWLVFFSVVKVLLILSFISNILDHLFLLLILVSVMSSWRHMQTTYVLMGLPQPLILADAEAASAARSSNVTKNPDLPPKYEEVA